MTVFLKANYFKTYWFIAYSLMKRVVFFVWYKVSFMWNGRLEFLAFSAGEGIFGGYSS